jgi:ribosomal-protein-alanine N-acetyltransferase
MHVITQTPRLIIREFLPDEQAVYLHHFTDEEVCRYIPVRTTGERINIFQTALNNYAISKQTGIWGMFNKENGEFIGSCLLRPFNNNPAVMEIGYSVDRIYWGQGIATEMVKAMIAYSFTHDDITAVKAVTTLENVGSQKVLEKAGLIRVDNILRDGLELAYFKLSKLI